MALLNFNNLPVNTLVGADSATFKAVTTGMEIDAPYRRKFKLTRSLQGLLSPLYAANEKRYARLPRNPETEDPVFILGHWRSGTTFVHNVLSQDTRFGYCSTYQTVFPHLMAQGKGFFKWCMGVAMPSRRPTDSMELGADLPQEEEFALANMTPCSFYHFWVFPRKTAEYREKYLLFYSITEEERTVFKQTLDKLIRIALHDSGKRQFLSKNPPHTGRVRTLLEMYPNAKFIYLVRNPYTVFESTRKFFSQTMPSLQLQDIARENLVKDIILNYQGLYRKYESEKALVPAGNLVEVRFEDFEQDPLGVAESIYAALSIKNFATAKEAMSRYVEAHRSFRKNKYSYAPETVRIVEENWGEALHQWNYKL